MERVQRQLSRQLEQGVGHDLPDRQSLPPGNLCVKIEYIVRYLQFDFDLHDTTPFGRKIIAQGHVKNNAFSHRIYDVLYVLFLRYDLP